MNAIGDSSLKNIGLQPSRAAAALAALPAQPEGPVDTGPVFSRSGLVSNSNPVIPKPATFGVGPVPTKPAAPSTDPLQTRLEGLSFDRLTPAGENVMKAARWWMDNQAKNPHFPQPRMCAQNVDKVLTLAGITQYKDEGVRNLIADVKSHGGTVAKMPVDKAGFIARLNGFYDGHLPAGTLVAGENVQSANPGEQHVGMIGNTEPDGTVYVYHNNWYRPENENGQRKPYMVSQDNLNHGFKRQWMATPWIKVHRDASGKIDDVQSLMPAIDDMDPFNKSYGVTLATPSEIASQLKQPEPGKA